MELNKLTKKYKTDKADLLQEVGKLVNEAD